MAAFQDTLLRWRRSVYAAVLVVVLACTTAAWHSNAADLSKPSAQDRQVTLMVKRYLKDEHLSRRALDDEVSERGLKGFLRTLDPLKVYFYQSDINEFLQAQQQLDDRLLKGDIRFAYIVFNRFLSRIDERVAAVKELLQSKFDFDRDEMITVDGDVAKYPRSADEAKDRWRRRLKYDLLVLETEKVTGEEARKKLDRRYTNFAKRMHQTDSDELLEMYLTAFTSSYDPHTTYMSPSTLENFRILMRLNLEGIGAALRVEDGYTVVSEIIPGGAADKDGNLKPEDKIVSVGQDEDGEMVDIVDQKLSNVVKLIRGKKGTVVRLGVVPAKGGDKRTYKITRARIELKDSEARSAIREVGKRADGKPFRVGVINLPSFYMDMEAARLNIDNYKSTTRDVRIILKNFRAKGVDAVLLDLRRNGGGSLTEAINLTGLFIDKGPVVQVKDSDGRVNHFDDENEGLAWSGPLVVATSKFSASASEILAGAVQDYRRGIIIGDRATHGKGTVQSLLDLGDRFFRITAAPNLGALKITMQQFYRPSGDSTQKRGVLADVVLPSFTDHMDVGEADLDYAMEFDKVDKVEHDDFGLVTSGIIRDLSRRSTGRVKKSEDFGKLIKDIDRYKTQKAKKKVTLNREKFFAERKDLDAQKEDEKQLEEQTKKDKVFADNYYNRELLDITTDYIQELRKAKLASGR